MSDVKKVSAESCGTLKSLFGNCVKTEKPTELAAACSRIEAKKAAGMDLSKGEQKTLPSCTPAPT